MNVPEAEQIWQDIQPGDLISLPHGRTGFVVGVLPGIGPSTANATIVVLTLNGLQEFTKAVLDDDPVLQRPPADRVPELKAALERVPSEPASEDVAAIFASVERPISDAGWARLSRRLAWLPCYGR
jgi:hypothetical protein